MVCQRSSPPSASGLPGPHRPERCTMSSATPPSRRDPVRTAFPGRPDRRANARLERDRLLAQLDEVDNEITELSRRRSALADRLAELREELWPTARYRRGRRPSATGRVELPPLPDRPTWLEGRRLRSVCLALLRRAGELSLPRLHALLHAHGYGVASTHPVKALSDALSYEVECGRARRPRRGHYAVHGPAPRRGRHGAPELESLRSDLGDDEADARLLDPTCAPAAP